MFQNAFILSEVRFKCRNDKIFMSVFANLIFECLSVPNLICGFIEDC